MHLYAWNAFQPRVATGRETERVEERVTVLRTIAHEAFHIAAQLTIAVRVRGCERLGAYQIWRHTHDVEALRCVCTRCQHVAAGFRVSVKQPSNGV